MKNQNNVPTKRFLQIGITLPVMAVASLLSTGSVAQVAVPLVITMNTSMPNPNGEISAERRRAHQLLEAITGISVPIDDERVSQMTALIAAGNERGAAAIATSDPAFYDFRMRDIARQMSVRDESIQAPLSDFVATFVGVARDNTDARELLTGNFYYRADTTKTLGTNGLSNVRDDVLNDIVNSNRHYDDIMTRNYSLYAVLIREEGQRISDNNGTDMMPATTSVLPDAAGLITTRGFMMAHADAGTNRRLVEYSFREFMCVPMEAWMDASRPDDFVGRDVDRFPGGSNDKYQVTCKACHTQMDGFRQAFARVDFTGNRVRYNPNGVANKLNRNANVFPEGFRTINDTWVNYATAPKNADQFGWRGALTGQGMNAFGTLLANSKGFSRCMTKRIFSAICKREPGPPEEGAIRYMADNFEVDYKLKKLAEEVAVSPICMSKKK